MMTGPVLGDPLGGVPDSQWDHLAGEHFYSSSAWLRYCARYADGRAGAVVVQDDGAATAAVPLSEVTSPPPALYRWGDLLESHGLPRIPPVGIMLGVAQGFQTHLLGRRPDPREPRDPTGQLVEGARWLRNRQGTAEERACVGMYLTTADVLAARDAGVRALPVLLDVDAWIDVPAGGWDAWLHTLPYKRRLSVRRDVRRFHEAGYRISHRALSDCYLSLPPLAQSTQGKYGQSQPTDFYLGLLKAHVDGMGAAARVAVCAREHETPVGFCLYYVWRDTIYLRWAGFDRARTVHAAEYFNLVYYTQIESAPQTGVRRIHAGIKATEAKALRGARLHPLWMLDLDDGGPLVRREREVRTHNRRMASRVLDNRKTVAAVADPQEWSLFG